MENSIKKYTKNQLHYHNSLMIKEKFPAFPVQSRSSRSSRLFKSLIGNDSFYTISTPKGMLWEYMYVGVVTPL